MRHSLERGDPVTMSPYFGEVYAFKLNSYNRALEIAIGGYGAGIGCCSDVVRTWFPYNFGVSWVIFPTFYAFPFKRRIGWHIICSIPGWIGIWR